MSNTLYISVMRFEEVAYGGAISYGFTAADSYGSYYEDAWSSMDEFYRDIPNAEALKTRVLSSEMFDSFDPEKSGSIVISFPDNDDTQTMTDDSLRAVCEANHVRIVQATEDEVRGMWDWVDEAGNACDHSFATEREAMQNAILELDLE